MINAVLNIALLSVAPIAWIIWLATGGVMLVLGFLLGIGIMKTFVKDERATAKADEMIVKLTPYQGTLGLIAIGLGLWGVLRSILH